MPGNVCGDWELVLCSNDGLFTTNSLPRAARHDARWRDTAKFNQKNPLLYINTRRRPPERVLSTVLIATVAVVAVVIENLPRKGATGR